MAKPSWLFGAAVAVQLYLFSSTGILLSVLLLLVSAAVLARLLRVYVLDKWRHQVPADGSWWVLITGTSSGFGQLGALRLASLGFNVVATVRKLSDGQALLDRAPSDAVRRRLHVLLMDVSSVASIKAAKEEVVAKLQEAGGQLVAVINNAGYSVSGRMEVIPIGKWKKQFDVNVFGVVAVTQAFIPLLRNAAKQGLPARVVYLGSVVGDVAMAETGPYSSSKFAVQAIADAARVEFSRYGIKVVVIQPGAFKTEFFKRLINDYLAYEGEEGNELIDEEMKRKAIESFEHSGPVLSAMASFFPPSDPVAGAIETSVMARMPETKIFVGYDCGLYYFLSAVPDELSDFVKYLLLTLPATPFLASRIIGAQQEKPKDE